MKHFVILMALIITCNFTIAQFVFKNDEIEKSNPQLAQRFNELDSLFLISSVNEFEFRFWAISEGLDSLRLFVLVKKNNKLSARLFLSNRWSSKNAKEIYISNERLPQLWAKLNQNQILKLPEYSLLKTKEGKIPDIKFYDGNNYRFQFFSKNNKKSYDYFCPRAYGEAYSYITEFKKAQKIIELIFAFCGLGLKC